MAGLVPASHASCLHFRQQGVDARHEAGHDARRRQRPIEKARHPQAPDEDVVRESSERRRKLYVHGRVQRVLLDELAARLDDVAHQFGEDVVGFIHFAHLHLQ